MTNESKNRIEAWIRQGNFQAAQAEIQSCAHASPGREDRLKLAEFARRAGIPHLAVQLLNPVVRPKVRAHVQATAQEITEYAAALIRIGAAQEALALLSKMAPTEHGSILLFRAFAHIHQWEYEEAVSPLITFVNDKRTTDYQRTVANVNLAASYIHTAQYTHAEPLLARLRDQTRDAGNTLLFGNTLELSAQNAVLAGEFDLAEELLGQAETLLSEKGVDSVDALYIRKWRAVVALKKSPGSQHALSGIQEVIRHARVFHEWETLRDCDFHLGVATGDRDLLLKVYFGTPYPSFRKQILLHLGAVPSQFQLGEGERVVDLEKGGCGKASLRYNQIPHRLLKILASDLYHPQRLVVIHSKLFSDRFYSPYSSPAVIHQAIKRLRQWGKKNAIGFEIEEDSSTYRLRINSPWALIYSANEATWVDHLLRLFKEKSDAEAFSAGEAAQALGVSKRSAIHWLNAAIAEGKVARKGTGPATKYEVTSR